MKPKSVGVTAILVMAVTFNVSAEDPSGKPQSSESRVIENAMRALEGIPATAAPGQKEVQEAANKVLTICGDGTLSALKKMFAETDSKSLRRKILLASEAIGKTGSDGYTEFFIEVLKTSRDTKEKELSLDFLKDTASEDAVREIVLTTLRVTSTNLLKSKARRSLYRLPPEKRERVLPILMKMAEARGARAEVASLRKGSIEILAVFPGEDVTQFLMKQLDNPDDQVRLAAVRGIGRRKCPAALEKMLELMRRDGNVLVRREATRNVTNAGRESSIPALIDALEDGDKEIRKTALRSLERMTGQHLGTQQNVWKIWRKQENTRLESLFDMLQSESPEKLVHAISALASQRIGHRDISERIASFAYHESPDVQRAALRALGRLGQKESVPVLLEALQTDDDVTLVVALAALSKMAHEKKRIVKATARFAIDYNESVAGAACDLLGGLGERSAVPILLDATKALDGQPLRKAIRALGRIGAKDEKVVKALLPFVDDEDGAVAVEACAALAEINGRKAIPKMIDMLSDPRRPVASAAHTALRKMTGNKMPLDREAWTAWWAGRRSSSPHQK